MQPEIWPEIDGSRCNGCGACLAACQYSALGLADGKAVLSRPDLCQYDGQCELTCPTQAIQLPYAVLFVGTE